MCRNLENFNGSGMAITLVTQYWLLSWRHSCPMLQYECGVLFIWSKGISRTSTQINDSAPHFLFAPTRRIGVVTATNWSAMRKIFLIGLFVTLLSSCDKLEELFNIGSDKKYDYAYIDIYHILWPNYILCINLKFSCYEKVA